MSPSWQEVEDFLYALPEEATVGDAMAEARKRRGMENAWFCSARGCGFHDKNGSVVLAHEESAHRRAE